MKSTLTLKYRDPPLLLLQLGGRLIQPQRELLPLPEVPIPAEHLQVLEVGLGVQQLVLCGLKLLGQMVAAGTSFPKNLFYASDFVFVLGENLRV